MRSRLFAAAMIAAFSHAQADDNWTWERRVGFGVQDLDYRETADDGRRLNRESGLLPGLVANLQGRREHWLLDLDVSLFGGDVSYDGETNTGAPIATRTDERFTRVEASLGRRFQPAGALALTLSAGGGLRFWSRDIRSVGNVSGVDELYRWPYFQLGLGLERSVDDANRIGLDMAVWRPVAANLDVEFRNGYDDVTLEPEGAPGGQVTLWWSHRLDGQRRILLSGWYERWVLDASDREPLSIGGVVVGSVYEPESVTEMIGFSIQLQGWF